MAIKKSITYHGVSVPDAWIRVVNPRVLQGNRHMEFAATSSSDDKARHFCAEAFECSYDLNGPNILVQAYDYLKTLPQFEGATDC